MTDIAVVDYGMGNLRSVAKALDHVAPERDIVVTRRPGGDPAGRRGSCCRARARCPTACACLDESGLRDVVLTKWRATARSSASVSACRCCSTASEEGPTPGLSACCAGDVVRFRDEAMTLPSGERLKVPHMGWSPVRQARAHPLWAGIPTARASISRTAIIRSRRIPR